MKEMKQELMNYWELLKIWKNSRIYSNLKISNIFLKIEFFENYIECEFNLKDSELKVKFKNMLELADILNYFYWFIR